MRDALRDAYVSAFREQPSRDVLMAFYAEVEGAPPPATQRAGDDDADAAAAKQGTQPPDTESLAKTKVERAGARVTPAPEPRNEVAGPSGPGKLQTTLPLSKAQRSPLAAAAPMPAPAVLTTSKPVSTEPAAPPRPSSPDREPPKRSAVPIVVVAALVVGLAVGLALMLAARGRTAAAPTEGPPAALSVIPSASAPAPAPSSSP